MLEQLPPHISQNTIHSPSSPNIEEQIIPSTPKQRVKPVLLTNSKILFIVLTAFIFSLLGYWLYSGYIVTSAASKASIISSNQKFIQSASSSSGANQAKSTASQSTQNSNKPMDVSPPAGKTIIGANTGASFSTGSGSGDGDDDDQDEENKANGDKRNRMIKSQHKKNEESTEEDESDIDDESEEDSLQDKIAGQFAPRSSNLQNVGSTRG